ncbi:hypothetical protein AGMMS49992_25340 [Clostridia bacterium]|nr:hypothetical protein AGMMS49992_25340 [Clostridia bacterium]
MPHTINTWNSWKRVDFTVNGRESFIICPKQAAIGRPWVWRAEFFGAFDSADQALLNQGWHVAYHRVSDMYGCPQSVEWMSEFHRTVVNKYNLSAKPVIFGFSRGGLYAVNYAAVHADKVLALYLDAPVLDIRSWPGVKGSSAANDSSLWTECLRWYGLTEETAASFQGNPLDKARGLAETGVPVVMVVGLADDAVPYAENGAPFRKIYEDASGAIKVIEKPDCGHHPHSLEDPTPITQWIVDQWNKRKPANILKCAADYQIFARNSRGVAQVPLAGTLPSDTPDNSVVFARWVREDDNLVGPYVLAEQDGTNWYVDLTVPEGGLFRLEVRAVDGGTDNGQALREKGAGYIEWSPIIKLIRHIGVGELYLLTGQSNMAGYGRDAAYDPPALGIHLYGNDGRWSVASHPLNNSVGTIYPENKELPCGTSPALAFGRMLLNRLNVPVGLVQASLGGSPLSAWHPLEDGILYRAMIRRLDAVGPVSGVIWYQGCSDTDEIHVPAYLDRFKKMVEYWRITLGDVPIATVQLNRWVGDPSRDRYWGIIREAQRQAAKQIPAVSVIPSTDLPINDGIHNASPSNVAIGERMASAILATHYNLPGALAPDVSRVVRIAPNQLAVEFEGDNFATPMDNVAFGMDVEDETGIMPCVRAELLDRRLILTTERNFANGAKFHALWRGLPPLASPRGSNGLPMLSVYNVPIE